MESAATPSSTAAAALLMSGTPQGAEELPRLMLMQGVSVDATLRAMGERLVSMPERFGWLVTHSPFWVYASIIAVCFYIFHRLTQLRSEENNIWAIASKERKIEAKIMEEEKEEEKKKDKLERRTRETKKQRLLRELHPSIADAPQILKRRATTNFTSPSGSVRDETNNGADEGSSTRKESQKERDRKISVSDGAVALKKAGQEANNNNNNDNNTSSSKASKDTTPAAAEGEKTTTTTTTTTSEEKKKAKNRRRRLSRRAARAHTTTGAGSQQ